MLVIQQVTEDLLKLKRFLIIGSLKNDYMLLHIQKMKLLPLEISLTAVEQRQKVFCCIECENVDVFHTISSVYMRHTTGV